VRPFAGYHQRYRDKGADEQKDARGEFAEIERAVRISPGFHADEETSRDRREYPDSREREGEKDGTEPPERGGEGLVCHEYRAQGHGGDDGSDVTLEQVGAHPRHIADVVPDVVRDRCGIERMVLGNARLDFADEVGADVGRLRIDAAADTGEERDRGRTEGKTGDDGDHLADRLLVRADCRGENGKEAAEPEDAETDHAQAHHGAAGEGDAESLRQAGPRCVSRPDVGLGRREHSDETGQTRTEGTRDKRDRDERMARLVCDSAGEEQGGDDEDKDREHLVFRPEEGDGALGDVGGDSRHAIVSRVLACDPTGPDVGERESQDAE